MRCLNFGPNSAFDYFFHMLSRSTPRNNVASSRRSNNPSISQKARHCAGVTVVTKPALLGFIDADGKCRPEAIDADPAHDVPAQEGLEHNVFGDRNARFEDRQLAGSAVSIVHAARHGRRRRYKAPQAGKDAGLEIGCVNWRSFDWSDQLHQSRQRTNGRVGRLKIPVWTFAAKPTCFDMNKARIVSLEHGKINAGQSAASISRPSIRMSQSPISSVRRNEALSSVGASATLDLLKLRNANQALCPFGV